MKFVYVSKWPMPSSRAVAYLLCAILCVIASLSVAHFFDTPDDGAWVLRYLADRAIQTPTGRYVFSLFV